MQYRKLVMGLLIAAPLAASAESYTIDPAHTYPNFSIGHLGFSTMHGRFEKTQGKITMDKAKKTGSVDVTIDAASVSTGFQKRDDHLRSPDFLNAAEFPTLTFKSTKVTINADDSASVQGNLTLAGVTKPATLAVRKISCGANPMDPKQFRCGFDASTRIKRSDFGVKFALPAVSDDMTIDLEVEAIRD